MRTVTAEYAAKLAALTKRPAYLYRCFHVAREGGGIEYPFSVDFVTHRVPGLAGPSLILASAPMGNTQTVDPENGTSTIGTFSFTLTDVDNEITRYLANQLLTLAVALSAGGGETIVTVLEDVEGTPSQGTLVIGTERIPYTGRANATFTGCTRPAPAAHAVGDVVQNGEQLRAGQRVQIYAGYQDLDFSAWLPFAKVEIGQTGTASAVAYTIACQDVQRLTQTAVFLAATQEAPVTFAGNPIELALMWLLSDGTAANSTGTVQGIAPNTVQGVGTAFDAADFLQPGDWVVIGLGAGADQQFVQVATVVDSETFTTVDPVVGTATGLAYRRAGPSSKYNVLAAYDALGLPASFVDIEGLETLRDEEFPDQQYLYRVNAPTDGKAFLEAHVKSLNCYPAVTGTGAWSLRRYRAVAQTAEAVMELDQSNIVSWEWAGSEASIINVAEFQYDWNLSGSGGQDDYKRRQRYRALDSITKYGARPVFKIAAPGLRTDLGAQAILDDRAFKLFTRFADPPATLHVFTFYGTQQLEPGDVVSVTHRRIPNRRTGQRGLVNERFEVRNARPMFGSGGGMDLTLLHVGGMTIPAVPFSDGEENNLKTLIVARTAFQNAAAVALSSSEVVVATSTVELHRSTDAILIQGRVFLDASVSTIADYAIARVRVSGLGGTLLDSIVAPSFVEGASGKSALVRSAGVLAFDTLYVPEATGLVTIVVTGAFTAGSAGTATDRQLALTLRSR